MWLFFWHVFCVINTEKCFHLNEFNEGVLKMILDAMTYSVMAVIAVLTFVVILLACTSMKPTK